MDLIDARRITNDARDVRLISLRSWQAAQEIDDHDNGGPYIILQEGYDPDDLTMSPDEFVLGRSGHWVSTGHFFKLPKEERRRDYIFPTAASVMEAMAALPLEVRVVRLGSVQSQDDHDDDQGLAQQMREGQTAVL